jgi:hypothetical protein
MTVFLYARRKGWPLKSVAVECEHERVHCKDSERSEEHKGAFIEVIRRRIELDGDLDEEHEGVNRLHRDQVPDPPGSSVGPDSRGHGRVHRLV